MQRYQSKLHAGDRLAERYLIRSIIGQGGMGTVYLAEDAKLPGKRWAVKELPPHIGSQYAAVADEARILAGLSHPFLPGVADFFPPDGQGFSYLVMDWVEGVTLQRIFEETRPFPWEKAVRIALQVCDVFAYLHERKPNQVIYRDLKPSNIMVDAQGDIRLVDFGAARHFNPSSSDDTLQLGTHGFAAPEQYAGTQSDPRTDLYGLGAVLFYLLSGGDHYNRPGMEEGLSRNGVPEALSKVVKKLLEQDPARRFQSARDARRELTALLATEGAEHSGGAGRKGGGTGLNGSRILSRKLIVIGGLYPGAGASFVAEALSRLLNRLQVPHAYVETPGAGPDLYQRMNGDRFAPAGYTFRMDREGSGANRSARDAWTSGYTEWVPLPPDRVAEPWTAEQAFRLLNGLTQPVIVADAGDRWGEPGHEAVCGEADLIVAVCGPSPVKLGRPSSCSAWSRLEALEKKGCSVHLVANQDQPFRGRNDWYRSMPHKPLCSVRSFPPALMLESEWQGTPFPDRPDVLEALEADLLPLLRLILPDGTGIGKRNFSIRKWLKAFGGKKELQSSNDML